MTFEPANCLRLAIGFLVWLLAAPAVWAQAPKNGPPGPAEKGYVLCYLVVVLAVALGLMLVCRSTNRAKEIDE
jgi:hypothetical protein